MNSVSPGNDSPQPLPDRLLFFSLMIFCIGLPWSLALMQIGLLLVVLSAFAILVAERRLPERHVFWWVLAVYLLLRLLSVWVSPEPARSFRAVYQQDWTLLALPFLASIRLPAGKWRQLLTMLLISAALVGIYGIFQMFSGMEYFRGKHLASMGNFYRATGGYNFYLTFAGNQLLFFSFLLGFFLLDSRRSKGLQLSLLLIFFGSVIATFGRSTWLALIVVIAVGTLLVNRRFFFIAMGLALAGGIAAALLFPEVQQRFMSIFDPSQNAARLNLWLTSLNMIEHHPLWGVGPGRFNIVFETYRIPGFYDAFGHSHNDYLNMAVNSGIPVLLVWAGLLVVWFRKVLRGFFQGGLSLQQRQILLGSVLALSGILFAALFQCYYTDLENNIAIMLFLGLGLGETSATA